MDWIEARLASLGQALALDTAAYAVMENHVHVVLHMDPLRPHDWSNQEVARRWLSIFPLSRPDPQLRVPEPEKVAELAADPGRLAECRKRLGDLSWVMRGLNEWMARRANREDKCTGRYWEGRYKCQRIADAGGLLMAMMYVDLNPVRARVVDRPEDARHTSLRKRLAPPPPAVDGTASPTANWLLPMEEIFPEGRMNMPHLTLAEYLPLVDYMGRKKRGKQGAIPADLPPIFERFGLNHEHLPDQLDGLRRDYAYLIGSPETLRRESEASGRNWGSRTAAMSLCYRPGV
jgi:hypothetical protein